MYYIKQTTEFGRGLYANRSIDAYSQIMLCELLILSPPDTLVVNTTDLKHYTFVFNKEKDCLVLGDGEIFNHSDEPNVSYKLVYYNNRYFMDFCSNKNIRAGQQLFIDYNADTKVNVNDYIKAKSML
jgi:uncharacterized protein